MNKINDMLQKTLLLLGALALIFLLIEIGTAVAAAQQGGKPARIDHVTAGPYHFTVSLYDNPARAGFALPFAVAPDDPMNGSWTYEVTSVPVGTQLRGGQTLIDGKWAATPVRDGVSRDPHVPGGVRGAAEITVRGTWNVQVVVRGPLGQQMFVVPIMATTISPVSPVIAWFFGFLPVGGIVIFLVMQMMNRNNLLRFDSPGRG
jgi:hypothetical protein